MKNRNGIPILDRPKTVMPVMPVGPVVPVLLAEPAKLATPVPPPAQLLIKHESPIVCATEGCRLPGVFLRADGPCCPDCLPAVLVTEHRAATRGVKYLYDEVPA